MLILKRNIAKLRFYPHISCPLKGHTSFHVFDAGVPTSILPENTISMINKDVKTARKITFITESLQEGIGTCRINNTTLCSRASK